MIDRDGWTAARVNMDLLKAMEYGTAEPGVESDAVFARCTNVGTNGYKILSSNMSILQPAGAGEQMTFVSTSVEDNITGTGLRKLMLTYFDNLWVKHTETIEMDGTTDVNTVATNINRIQTIQAISRGSNNGAVGNITVMDYAAGTNLYAEIEVNRTLFQRCLYYVAPGNVAVVNALMASSTTSDGTNFLFIIDKDFSGVGGDSKMACGLTCNQNAYGTVTIFPPRVPLIVDARDWTVGRAFAIVATGEAVNQNGTGNIFFYEMEG